MIGRRAILVVAAVSATLLLLPSAPAVAQKAAEIFSGFQSKSKDPIQVDAETLEVYEEGDQRVSVFSGGVTVRRGKSTLKASVIKLYSDLKKSPAKGAKGTDAKSATPAAAKTAANDAKAATPAAAPAAGGFGPGGGSFTRMEATGRVYVNSETQTATGNSAVVDMKANTIHLIGNVVLSEGENVITGERLVVDMTTGVARVEQAPGKRIQGIFTPDEKKKDGKGGGAADKEAAAPGTKPATGKESTTN